MKPGFHAVRRASPFRCGLKALACAAALSLSACGGSEPEASAPRPALAVELIGASLKSWPDVIVASGEIAPWQEAIIGTELTGTRLDEVLVDVGDIVKKDQLIARFDEGMLRADLARLDAAVAEAKANVAKAKADAARADKLEANGVLSGQSIQVYRTQAEVAEAQLASANAQRSAQALKLRYARVLAPDAGVISSRSATVGAVSAMGGELFRLVRQNRLEWRAELPAETLSRLRPGTAVALRTRDGISVEGKLRLLSPTVDAGTRNGIAYVDLPADSGLVAGMYATGRFLLASRDATAVLESAIVLRDGNRYLMKVDEHHRVHEVKVSTGRRQDDAIEILDAIAPGDRFVKSGGAFIGDGDLVRVVSPAPPAS